MKHSQIEVLGKNLLSMSGNEGGFSSGDIYSELCLHFGRLISIFLRSSHVYNMDKFSWIS